MAKDKQFNIAVAITVRPEHEQTEDEAKAAVDAGKDQGRPGW